MCLDRTFQDAGGRLMDVVDEDPARGWIPPGGQFCKEISGIVVPSRDVMQFDSSSLRTSWQYAVMRGLLQEDSFMT